MNVDCDLQKQKKLGFLVSAKGKTTSIYYKVRRNSRIDCWDSFCVLVQKCPQELTLGSLQPRAQSLCYRQATLELPLWGFLIFTGNTGLPITLRKGSWHDFFSSLPLFHWYFISQVATRLKTGLKTSYLELEKF